MLPGHDEDDTLTGQVLLENLACKATAGLALRHLLARPGAVAADERALRHQLRRGGGGDRYQRGGGNLAKAVAEWAGCARGDGQRRQGVLLRPDARADAGRRARRGGPVTTTWWCWPAARWPSSE